MLNRNDGRTEESGSFATPMNVTYTGSQTSNGPFSAVKLGALPGLVLIFQVTSGQQPQVD